MRFDLVCVILILRYGAAWTTSVGRPNNKRLTTTLQMTPTKGQVVTVECRLLPDGDFVPEPLIDGVVMHEDDPAQTISFVVGRGNYLPGLHDAILQMKVGEERNGLCLDAGWGDVNPDLIATISFESSGVSKDQIKQGTQLQLANGMRCVVTNVSDNEFTIDANPPLAGASFKASVKLVKAEDGPLIGEYMDESPSTSRYQVFTCALGCFWGGELFFMREPGVVGTAVGYTQGSVVNPSYKDVCSGTTGHTEAIVVTYDPNVVTYEKLCHLAMDRLGENRYLLNQVGNDRGTQYRHGIYYHNLDQKAIAEAVVASFGEDCRTECLPARTFYFAEDYHQQYLLKGGQSARKRDQSVIRCYG